MALETIFGTLTSDEQALSQVMQEDNEEAIPGLLHTVISVSSDKIEQWNIIKNVLNPLRQDIPASSPEESEGEQPATFYTYNCNPNILFTVLDSVIDINNEQQLFLIFKNHLHNDIALGLLHYFLHRHFNQFVYQWLEKYQTFFRSIFCSTYCQRMILFYFVRLSELSSAESDSKNDAMAALKNFSNSSSGFNDININKYCVNNRLETSYLLPFHYQFLIIFAIYHRDDQALEALLLLISNKEYKVSLLIKFDVFNLDPKDSRDENIINLLINKFNVSKETFSQTSSVSPYHQISLLAQFQAVGVGNHKKPSVSIDSASIDPSIDEFKQEVVSTNTSSLQTDPNSAETLPEQFMTNDDIELEERERTYNALKNFIETGNKIEFTKFIKESSIQALDTAGQTYMAKEYPNRVFESLLATALFIEQCLMDLLTNSPAFAQNLQTAPGYKRKIMTELSTRFDKSKESEQTFKLFTCLFIIQHLLKKEYEENYCSNINCEVILPRFLKQLSRPNDAILMHNQWLLAYLLYYERLHPLEIVKLEQELDLTLVRDGVMSCLTTTVYSDEELKNLAVMKPLPIKLLSNMAKTLIAIWATQTGNVKILAALDNSNNGADSFNLATCPPLYENYPTLLFFAVEYLNNNIPKLSAVLTVLFETDIDFNIQNNHGQYAIDLARNKEAQKQIKLARKQQVIRQQFLPERDYTIDFQRKLLHLSKTKTRKELEDYFAQYS